MNKSNLSETIVEQLNQELQRMTMSDEFRNIGKVTAIKDGVIILSGLSEVRLMERIYCRKKSISAMVLNLSEFEVGALVMGEYTQISEGDEFEISGEITSIGVSADLVGHVVDALGVIIDGKSYSGPEKTKMPIERIAPGVIARQPVKVPLQTGIVAIDAMVPVGRGQRELIIGDRGTGKTAIAIDTIINQKQIDPPVICIYAAVGQKNSQVAQIVDRLEQAGAMEYTIVVNASASDSVVMQYIAPYAATAMAEYFMEQGRDVLVIYDDLTKHAWAYRQISLTLERPPGREAYPGDIFYLHSRLLERSCRLKQELGGGSITSLPIVETQFGDVSAYIPTNVISITDGQIYLETDFFNAGIRPAIDPGNSVSRVGGAAQLPEMKKVAGKLRLDLAQFKELEAFAQFGSSDLDEKTRQRINRGQRVRELLKQPQYQPLSVNAQVSLIFAVNNGYLDDVPLDQIDDFKNKFIGYLHTVSTNDPKDAIEDFMKTYLVGS
jgi:F-type H+-transporting ATPase subunit alpha